MKILTVLVPVYNTEKYIKRCLDSVLLESVLEDIEILVVSDGSKDGSVDIAKSYQEKFPETVRVIEKENGGHGSTINKGLELATGTYFRVLDSDDWFNPIDFQEFVKRLKDETSDLVVCNYRKEFVYESRSEFLQYKNLKEGTMYDFLNLDLDILGGEYFVMATSTYRTEVLRNAKLKLLEKTFYVDMQYNIVPMTQVKTFSYYELDIYRYFIGRPEQSVNLNSFVRNQEHHKKMIKWLIEYYTGIRYTLNSVQKKYIEWILYYTLYTHYTIYCEYDTDHKRAYKEILEFDSYLKQENRELYDRLNDLGDIRIHRKAKFIGVRFNGKLWKRMVNLCKRLKH